MGYGVKPVDDIGDIVEIKYPAIILSNIVARDQLNPLMIKDDTDIRGDLIVVDSYGEHATGLRYIGKMYLTTKLILWLGHLGISLIYKESSDKSSDLQDDKSLISLCVNRSVRP